MDVQRPAHVLQGLSITLSPQSSSSGACVRRSRRLMLVPLPVMMRRNTSGALAEDAAGCEMDSTRSSSTLVGSEYTCKMTSRPEGLGFRLRI